MADPIIGTLYGQPRAGYPAAQQPNGPGTPVTSPLQTMGEHLGMFFPGCGHSIRSWEVQLDTVAGAPAALILCPLCGYIQNIYQPPSLVMDVNVNPNIYG